MIEYTSGNILHADVEAIVNTVNCVGIMGRGIALQFKNAFPKNFNAYSVACGRGDVKPGRMFVFRTAELTNPQFIVNFPTKRHWRGKSKIEDIETGLISLKAFIIENQIKSIAIPPLGSGLGGLDWNDVRPKIESALIDLADVAILIFEPNGAPSADRMTHKRDAPSMTEGRAALIELISRYLNGLLDPYVSLLEVHKLMYFMQEAGEPLRLKFNEAHYGPYAENLRHVLKTIEGHFVIGYADGGDEPDKPIELVPGAVEDATNYLKNHSETRTRFDRVADLVNGFETPFGLELLSTVHWVAKGMPEIDEEAIVDRVYSWNERKRQFTERQIGLAVNALVSKGWVPNKNTNRLVPSIRAI